MHSTFQLQVSRQAAWGRHHLVFAEFLLVPKPPACQNAFHISIASEQAGSLGTSPSRFRRVPARVVASYENYNSAGDSAGTKNINNCMNNGSLFFVYCHLFCVFNSVKYCGLKCINVYIFQRSELNAITCNACLAYCFSVSFRQILFVINTHYIN